MLLGPCQVGRRALNPDNLLRTSPGPPPCGAIRPLDVSTTPMLRPCPTFGIAGIHIHRSGLAKCVSAAIYNAHKSWFDAGSCCACRRQVKRRPPCSTVITRIRNPEPGPHVAFVAPCVNWRKFASGRRGHAEGVCRDLGSNRKYQIAALLNKYKAGVPTQVLMASEMFRPHPLIATRSMHRSQPARGRTRARAPSRGAVSTGIANNASRRLECGTGLRSLIAPHLFDAAALLLPTCRNNSINCVDKPERHQRERRLTLSAL